MVVSVKKMSFATRIISLLISLLIISIIKGAPERGA